MQESVWWRSWATLYSAAPEGEAEFHALDNLPWPQNYRIQGWQVAAQREGKASGSDPGFGVWVWVASTHTYSTYTFTFEKTSEASILGAVAGAHFVRAVAPAYGNSDLAPEPPEVVSGFLIRELCVSVCLCRSTRLHRISQGHVYGRVFSASSALRSSGTGAF